jgi:quercetin dioxygenase-like cupin family protein
MAANTFEHSKIYQLKSSIDYASGAIVSKIISKNDAGNITLFAFDSEQNLSEHTAPFDAIIQLVEGQAKIIIDKNEYVLKEGDIINMPANVSHAVEALGQFKMLLTMLKTRLEVKIG